MCENANEAISSLWADEVINWGKNVYLVTLKKNPVRVRFKPVQTIFVLLAHQQSTLDDQNTERKMEIGAS